MQHVMIAGHLGADPVTRVTANNQKVVTLRVAVNVRFKGKDETVWWNVSIWSDRFDKLVSHLKKGSAIIVFGEMQPPELYTDREGKTHIRSSMNADQIRFSPFGKPVGGGGERQGAHAAQSAHGFESHNTNSDLSSLFGEESGMHDELPF